MSVKVEPALTNEMYCPTCEEMFAAGDRCPRDGARLVKIVAPTDPFLRRELDGRFTILEKIGQGGMGAVYRGTQHSVDREVAIKVVSTPHLASTNMIKRFFREAKLASRLSHPNAVGVVDFGQTQDGVFYLVMELIRGRTLDQVVKAGESFSPARIIRIGMQVCDALVAAHELEIVHRDLKPANIMMLADARSTSRDIVKVLDFGLAKSISADDSATTVSGDSTLLGTPAFISPEAVRGARVDGRSDLYSLGCILYLLGASKLPFEATSPQELVRMHGHMSAPPMTGVPEALAKVIDRMLARHPNDRFQTAAVAHEALEAALTGFSAPTLDGQDPTVNDLPSGRKRKLADAHSPRRRRHWLAIAAVVALALAIGSMVMIAGSRSSDEGGSAASAAPPSPPGPAQPTESPTPTETAAEPTPTAATPSPVRRPKPATKPKRPPVHKPPHPPSHDPTLPF